MRVFSFNSIWPTTRADHEQLPPAHVPPKRKRSGPGKKSGHRKSGWSIPSNNPGAGQTRKVDKRENVWANWGLVVVKKPLLQEIIMAWEWQCSDQKIDNYRCGWREQVRFNCVCSQIKIIRTEKANGLLKYKAQTQDWGLSEGRVLESIFQLV